MVKKLRSTSARVVADTQIVQQYSVPGEEPLVLSQAYAYPYLSSGTIESISYGNSRVKTKKGTRFASFNDCEHIVTRIENSGAMYASFTGTTAGSVYTYIPMSLPMHELDANQIFNRGFSVEPTDLRTFIQDAFWTMKPKFDSGVSVPNFFIELKDLLPKALSNLAKGMVQDIRENVFRTSASVHLTSSFAIQPLVSDIFAIIEARNLFNMKLKSFLAKAGKPQTSHFRRVIPGGEIPLLYHYEKMPMSGESLRSFGRISEKTVVATMKYRYMTPGMSPLPPIMSKSQERKLRKVFDRYMGWRTEKLASIVWNAIPFSFIVDWVYKVGNYLESYDPGAISTVLHVDDFCISEKYKYLLIGEHIMEGCKETDTKPGGYRNRVSYHRTVYRRTRLHQLVGNPVVPRTMPVTDTFSGRELMLAVSLGVANIR